MLVAGCVSPRIDEQTERAFEAGSYGEARVRLEKDLTDDRADRAYILDRMRLEIACLADGDPWAAEMPANDAFSILRVQGLNADRTTSAVVLNEGVKIWKGEPFEQALSYCYIAIQKGMLGEWDNSRAAASGSLFLLRDFGDNEKGEELSTLEIAQNAAREGDEYFDKGYAAVKTNFALGYLLNGVANKAILRDDEANDNFHEAAKVNAGLETLRDELVAGQYNTVLVVDFGPGPEKVRYGPDGALARFAPRLSSDQRGLEVLIGSGESATLSGTYPPACDVNTMAQDHMWNNLEDVRIAKSTLGQALMIGGSIAAVTADRNNQAQGWIGLGAIAAGAILRANSGADTRHLEFLPQRVYIAPVMIPAAGTVVTLQIVGEASSRIVLPAMSPPRDGLQMRYVRVPTSQYAATSWMQSGTIVYANDQYEGHVAGDDLPYILGGTCVKKPSQQTLRKYQAAGHLSNLTTVELENLYREEGITFTVEDQIGRSVLHVLEGGKSMVEPLAGSAGYARLFCQTHRAYVGKSAMWKDIKRGLETIAPAGEPAQQVNEQAVERRSKD